jgi:hypothetical protein
MHHVNQMILHFLYSNSNSMFYVIHISFHISKDKITNMKMRYIIYSNVLPIIIIMLDDME